MNSIKTVLITICTLLIGINAISAQSANPNDSLCLIDVRQVVKKYDEMRFSLRIKDIPKAIIKELSTRFDEKFEIVNPGHKFRTTDVVHKASLPNKRLIFVGFYFDYVLLFTTVRL